MRTLSSLGKIVLISRGNCTFSEKALNAQAAGASGVLVFDHIENELLFSMTSVLIVFYLTLTFFKDPKWTTPVTIPLVLIRKRDGIKLATLASEGRNNCYFLK